MSFFVSDALKGRVTEENLIEDSENISQEEKSLIYVRGNFKNFSHDFPFVSYKKEKVNKTLIFEIPESYEYTKEILESLVEFQIIKSGKTIASITSKDSDLELIRHYERSCYLLKIVISE